MKKITFINKKAPYLNATNLNQIQNNVEEEFQRGTKIASMTATISDDITLENVNTEYKMELTNLIQNNSDFRLSNNGGVICPFSGTVLITISAMFSPKKGYCGLACRKNNAYMFDYYESSGTQTYGGIETSNRFLNVNKDDVLEFTARSSLANDEVKAIPRSRVTIFYIDYKE